MKPEEKELLLLIATILKYTATRMSSLDGVNLSTLIELIKKPTAPDILEVPQAEILLKMRQADTLACMLSAIKEFVKSDFAEEYRNHIELGLTNLHIFFDAEARLCRSKLKI